MPTFLATPEGLQKLQAAKARLNLSFVAIAKQAGVSADTVSRLFHPERGERVNQLSLEAIAQVLQLAPEKILSVGEWQQTLEDAGFQEAERRIQQAFKTSAEAIDLSELGLRVLPKSIGHLINLIKLKLSRNHLTVMPRELGNLANLEALDVSRNELIELPNEIGNLKNLTCLDVSHNKLSGLPKSLGKLTNLILLCLPHNQLKELVEELSDLTNLRVLYLSHNRLTALPHELGGLFNLTRLDVPHNELVEIPKELSDLANLKELHLRDNKIAALPHELGGLSSLTRLDLSHNLLSAVPQALGKLTNLKVLCLSHNKLVTAPRKLETLTKLTQLDLSHNKLKQVPNELGCLTNLIELFLDHNQLEMVPKKLGKLSNLMRLSLSYNQLEVVPEELGNLNSLMRLTLDHNQLVQVPGSLSKIMGLVTLDISYNQLKRVPKGLKDLVNLTAFYLHGNEKLSLSREILGPTWKEVGNGATPASPQEILDYYFRIQSDRTPLNEAKLILVGFGSVGKTSLVNRLIHNTFDLNSKKTEGIQITQWPICLNGDEDITLHVWDFGGQEIMHSTHQFFLTERSLYLLVLNGRQGHEDADAEYWLELIQSFGGDSPVIVVLNKVQEHPFDVNRRALQEKFPAIRAFLHTDCGADIGIDQLRTVIERESDRLEYLRAPFPSSWVTIKNRLAGMAENYISFEKYRDICDQDGETDLSAQDSLAVHLHSLGIALNYKDDTRLRDTHVLNPHWVTNGIYTLLNAHELADTQGELEVSCLTRTLDPQNYPRERHGFLLELMRKFELCFPFAEEDNRYLIPDLLDKQQPREATAFNPADCLNFRYRYPILPEGLLPRFIVRTHVLSNQALRWRTGVILSFEGNRALVRADRQDRYVTISVDGPVASRRRLLAVIRSDFDRIHRSFKFIPQELVPIPGHPNLTVTYKELIAREKKGRQSFEVVLDNDELLELNVQDLLNGIDIEGSRKRTTREEGRRPLRLFYSYSHKDEVLRDQLDTHLKILERQNLIQPWHDRRIDPGMEFAVEIDDNLNRADIILFLVSADFMSSDYCYDTELPQALRLHESGDATVIPILIRPVDWQSSPLATLSVLPTNGRAVTQWSDRDAAWLDVEAGIKRAIEAVRARR